MRFYREFHDHFYFILFFDHFQVVACNCEFVHFLYILIFFRLVYMQKNLYAYFYFYFFCQHFKNKNGRKESGTKSVEFLAKYRYAPPHLVLE